LSLYQLKGKKEFFPFSFSFPPPSSRVNGRNMAQSVYVLTCLVALAVASPAQALQLTNRDTADHKIALTEPAGTQDVQIKPSQVIDGICKAGCTMKMADGEEYEFDGNEVVSIEEGLMFLDEPADANSAGTDDPAAADAAPEPPVAAAEKSAAPAADPSVPNPAATEKK
jgi:hypothetical protein